MFIYDRLKTAPYLPNNMIRVEDDFYWFKNTQPSSSNLNTAVKITKASNQLHSNELSYTTHRELLNDLSCFFNDPYSNGNPLHVHSEPDDPIQLIQLQQGVSFLETMVPLDLSSWHAHKQKLSPKNQSNFLAFINEVVRFSKNSPSEASYLVPYYFHSMRQDIIQLVNGDILSIPQPSGVEWTSIKRASHFKINPNDTIFIPLSLSHSRRQIEKLENIQQISVDTANHMIFDHLLMDPLDRWETRSWFNKLIILNPERASEIERVNILLQSFNIAAESRDHVLLLKEFYMKETPQNLPVEPLDFSAG